MFDYIAKIRRGTANVDIIIIIIGSTEVLFDSSICIIGYNTISNRDRIRYKCVVGVVVEIKPSMKGWRNIIGIKPSMKGWRNIIGIKPSMKGWRNVVGRKPLMKGRPSMKG